MQDRQVVAVISGTGLYTPTESVSNAELVSAFNAYVVQFNSDNEAAIDTGQMEALQESSVAFIDKASGIGSRFVMNKSGIVDPLRMCPDIPDRGNDQPSLLCEMAIAAATDALQAANKTAADIDAVLVACSNLQRAYPAIAVELQNALGIDGFGFDMNVACSSATFGIQTAVDSIRNGSTRAVLMVNPEVCTGHLNFRDRNSHFIFGDACTAVVVEREDRCSSDNAYEVLGTKLKTQFSNNIRNNFGFLNRGDESGVGQDDKLFTQNGRKVFKEVVPMVAQLIQDHLGEHDLQPEVVKRFWLHQANLSMNQLIGKMLLGKDIEAARLPVILDRYANTSSAGSIIAFHLHNDDLQSGDTGLLCSFGAGYSVGSVILKKR